MQWNMTDRKMVPLNWKKKDGSAGTATDVNVTSSDETVATAEIKEGAVYITNIGPGKATLTVTGDTDPGNGVKSVSNAFDVEILGEFAENLEFGEPADQPPAV